MPEILFEDANIIVISKPAGLLSQGERRGDPNVVDWLRKYLGRSYVGLVHRLDRNASGVMVVAKRTKAARRLTDSLQSGKLLRTYLAWVEGTIKSKQRWVHWLLKDSEANMVRITPPKRAKAKEAVLSATPIRHVEWKGKKITLAEFKLETGRSHQIRVQSAAKGHPLLGDTKYGTVLNKHQKPAFSRLALHSSSLSFPHPISQETLFFEVPVPEDMAQIG